MLAADSKSTINVNTGHPIEQNTIISYPTAVVFDKDLLTDDDKIKLKKL